MRSSQSVKEVQQLVRRITALSRFLSRLAEMVVSIFKTLKKGGSFIWMTESEEAFQKLKAMLATPPVLTRPTPSSERRYQKIEKTALGLIITLRKLCPYFQGYHIFV
ncbi:hypothetical protein CR513_31313, partial [Mucuna pruriens]